MDASARYSGFHRKVDSLSKCQDICLAERNCVAFAYKFVRQLCYVLDKGPYTHGNGFQNTKCYVMTPGTTFTF